MNNIILIGFMGAGKTTVGKLLAEKTGMTHIDFDDKIEEISGCTIQEYFEKNGEAAFRQLEHEFLKDFSHNNHVVSTGGGIVLKQENRDILKKIQPVIYLQTEPEIFIERLKQDAATARPIVASKSPEEIKEVYAPRIRLYEESSTFTVDTNKKTPEEIVNEILEKLRSL